VAKEGWKKLHNEELHNLYPSPNIIKMIKSRRMRWVGHVARMEGKRKPCRLLVGKPERKRPLGRPRRRWVKNIKMDLREIGWLVQTGSIWLRIGNSRGSCEHVNELSGSINCWEFLE
jgi:hypothetical protein